MAHQLSACRDWCRQRLRRDPSAALATPFSRACAVSSASSEVSLLRCCAILPTARVPLTSLLRRDRLSGHAQLLGAGSGSAVDRGSQRDDAHIRVAFDGADGQGAILAGASMSPTTSPTSPKSSADNPTPTPSSNSDSTSCSATPAKYEARRERRCPQCKDIHRAMPSQAQSDTHPEPATPRDHSSLAGAGADTRPLYGRDRNRP